MEEIETFFERYKRARHDVYVADSDRRKSLRQEFFVNPEGRVYGSQSVEKALSENIVDSKTIENGVEITTTGCDVLGPRRYLLRKIVHNWRIEYMCIQCIACRGTGKRYGMNGDEMCENCQGTGMEKTTE